MPKLLFYFPSPSFPLPNNEPNISRNLFHKYLKIIDIIKEAYVQILKIATYVRNLWHGCRNKRRVSAYYRFCWLLSNFTKFPINRQIDLPIFPGIFTIITLLVCMPTGIICTKQIFKSSKSQNCNIPAILITYIALTPKLIAY